jgi:hypothetical protein
MVQWINAHRVVVGKTEEKNPLTDLEAAWRIILKLKLRLDGL